MIPVMHDRVMLGCSNETFLVVAVDYTRRKVDLAPVAGEFNVLENLPFDRLTPVSLAQMGSAAA